MDKLTAYKAVRQAGILGMIITGFGIMGLFTVIPYIDIYLQNGIMIQLLLSILIFFGLSYGTLKYNRFCSIGLLIYFIYVYGSRIISFSASFNKKPHLYILLVLCIIALFFLVQGVRGSFALHQIEEIKTEDN